VAEGVALACDRRGNLVGIDIDNASRRVALQRPVLDRLPGVVETNVA